MPNENQPSFSRSRRWKIGLDLAVRTVLVCAVVVMMNFLGAQFFHRFYMSSQTRVHLSSRTMSVLHSLTNRVTVTLYYDRKDDFYPDIVALLNEYHAVNPKISIRPVDYVRDAGEAQKIKEKYKLGSVKDKDLVIFDCGGHVKTVPSEALMQVKLEQVPNPTEREFRRKPIAFNGEMMFTAMLLAVENPQPLKAYFLQGHGEPSLTDSRELGYLKFASILHQDNNIDIEPLELLGDNTVPADCNLLIIADSTSGPPEMLKDLELQKISQYLSQGGRLFALFNYFSIKRPTGLEQILAQWGVNVGYDVVKDPQHTVNGQDMVVQNFSQQHPVVNPLIGGGLYMILPRPVVRVDRPNPPADAPQMDEIAFSFPDSTLTGDPTAAPASYPLMVAVEQKAGAGVANVRGTMRMLVVGDSFFLGNNPIDNAGNRDFLGYAVNWLLDRPQLLEGIGPRPVTEFRLQMTRLQRREVRWVLLGALPGAVLLFGGLVWMARRK